MAGFRQGGIELRKKTVIGDPSTEDHVIVYWNDLSDLIIKTSTGQEIIATETMVAGISSYLQGQITNLGDGYATDSELLALSGNLQGQISNNDLDIGELRTDVDSISGQVLILQTNTSGITGGISQLNDLYLNVGEGGFITTTEVEGISSYLQGQITNLRTDVNSISGQVLSNDNDISNLFSITTGLQSISGNHVGRITNLETYTSGISGGLTQLNNLYVNVTGDTMIGDLTTTNLTVGTGSTLTVEDLNIGNRLLLTNITGEVQQSEIELLASPSGGSGFSFVPYTSAGPVLTVTDNGFLWIQDIDVNTKKLAFFDGTDTFSVQLFKE